MTLMQQSSFSGPMPPPGMLADYDAIFPGAADRILTMTEREQAARHENQRRTLDLYEREIEKDGRLAGRGQFFGFLVAMGAITGATICVWHGHGWPAAALGIGGLGSIVAVFISGHRKREHEDEQTPPAA